MSNYTKKIAAKELQIGMYVEALDRAWLDTEFTYQGMRVETVEELERLQSTCEHVYVSMAPSAEQIDTPGAGTRGHAGAPAAAGPADSPPTERDQAPRSFQAEVPRARVIREQARLLVTTIHGDVSAGRPVDTEGAREVVVDMMDSVSRHPDALVWFTNLKNRDQYTALHSLNVCMLAITLASAAGLDAASVEEMGVGALLHDVGKLKVPLEVLNKPGKLTDEEFALMKKHPEFGVEILRDSPDLTPESIEIVLAHHERLNGTGYPRGLAANELSLYTQIVAIADVYDAMTSDRVYHKGRSPADVLGIMRNADNVFNDELLRIFAERMGAYPPGSLVELNTGEVGLVLPGGSDQEKPTVLIVLDHRKRRYYPQRVRDLSRFPNFKVVRVLAAGAYGIDVNDYAEQPG